MASGGFQAQVAQGSRVYGQWCSGCHGAQAQGAPGSGIPRLAGAGKPLGNLGTAQGLFTFVRANMPQDNPGSLSTDQYYAVTAYLLSVNGVGTGGQALGPGTAGGVSLK